MAILTFPTSPLNGQIYPTAAPIGVNIYQWSSADITWRLLGPASGVTAGTYGSATSIPQITVDPTGRITFAQSIPIQFGLVFLDDISSLFDGTTLSFGLSVAGSPISPGTNLLIFIGGTPQIAGSSYTVSGSTISFTGAPPAGATFIGVTVA